MDIKFPFNRDVEQAQEKILQAKSAQEIKELLKQDEPQRPNYQEALTRLVSQHIYRQFTPEEITKIENTSHLNPIQEYGRNPFSQDRSNQILKVASRMDNDISLSIITNASQKHDPHIVPKNLRDSFTPPTVSQSIPNAVLDHIKNYPPAVEKIFNDVLPKIKQEKNFERQASSEREIETARKAGYVQGVCECVAAIGEDHTLGKKLLTEMNVNKDMAKKYANPETYKALEQGIFAPNQEHKLEQQQSRGRGI